MFAWNMRYPGPTLFWGVNDIGGDGPVALPGRYRVRLDNEFTNAVFRRMPEVGPRLRAQCSSLFNSDNMSIYVPNWLPGT